MNRKFTSLKLNLTELEKHKVREYCIENNISFENLVRYSLNQVLKQRSPIGLQKPTPKIAGVNGYYSYIDWVPIWHPKTEEQNAVK
jgi:hypothetical protein